MIESLERIYFAIRNFALKTHYSAVIESQNDIGLRPRHQGLPVE